MQNLNNNNTTRLQDMLHFSAELNQSVFWPMPIRAAEYWFTSYTSSTYIGTCLVCYPTPFMPYRGNEATYSTGPPFESARFSCCSIMGNRHPAGSFSVDLSRSRPNPLDGSPSVQLPLVSYEAPFLRGGASVRPLLGQSPSNKLEDTTKDWISLIELVSCPSEFSLDEETQKTLGLEAVDGDSSVCTWVSKNIKKRLCCQVEDNDDGEIAPSPSKKLRWSESVSPDRASFLSQNSTRPRSSSPSSTWLSSIRPWSFSQSSSSPSVVEAGWYQDVTEMDKTEAEAHSKTPNPWLSLDDSDLMPITTHFSFDEQIWNILSPSFTPLPSKEVNQSLSISQDGESVLSQSSSRKSCICPSFVCDRSSLSAVKANGYDGVNQLVEADHNSNTCNDWLRLGEQFLIPDYNEFSFDEEVWSLLTQVQQEDALDSFPEENTW